MSVTKEAFLEAWPNIKDYLNVDKLAPYLLEEGLAEGIADHYNLITGDSASRQNCLLNLLSSKGPNAYQCFLECLHKETKHGGQFWKKILFICTKCYKLMEYTP